MRRFGQQMMQPFFTIFGHVTRFVQSVLTYVLLRDSFTTDRAVGTLNGTSADPGLSTRTVTDTTTPKLLYTENGYLRVNQATETIDMEIDLGWGTTVVSYDAVARSQGRTFCAVIDVVDLNSDFAIYFATSDTPSTPNGYGWLLENGALDAIYDAITLVIAEDTTGNIRPLTYLVSIVLQASGSYVLLSTFANDPGLSGNMEDPIGIPEYPNARIVWANHSGTTTPLYPMFNFDKVYNYPSGHAISEAWIVDLVSSGWITQNGKADAYDTFTRANNISSLGGAWTVDGGTFGISSNKAYVPGSGFSRAYLTGSANNVVECAITIGTDKRCGLLLRRVDANNYVRLWLNGQDAIYLQTWVAGGFGDTIVATGYTFVVGNTYIIRVAFQGSRYKVWINNVVVLGWTVDANARHLTGTGHGLFALDDGGSSRWDDFVIWPHTVTLPDELQLSGAANTLLPWTVGDTLASDTFTDTNGVRLASHTPTLGSAWIEHYGVWEMASNKLVVSGTGNSDGGQYATQPIAQEDVECSITITQPASPGDFIFAGIVGYVDSNNYVIIRLAAATVAQPNDYEIEVSLYENGVGHVVHKVQFGVAYPANSTHTLKAQFKGNTIRIFFDDNPRESYILKPAMINRTRFGVYHSTASGAQIYDTWLVKSIS